jgi:hypothetical protein
VDPSKRLEPCSGGMRRHVRPQLSPKAKPSRPSCRVAARPLDAALHALALALHFHPSALCGTGLILNHGSAAHRRAIARLRSSHHTVAVAVMGPALSSRAMARRGFDSPRDRDPRLAGLRRHSTVGTTSVGVLRRHRVSRWGERQGRKLLERGLVGCLTRGWVAATAASRWVRISGMTCSVLPIRDSQPHWQLARRWPLSVRAAGLTVTLCPATCSLTEMVTGHLRSVGNGRTYPLGKPVTKLPAQSMHASVAVAWVAR